MPERPRIAVVFATHNRAGSLQVLLDSLREQTLPADQFEVIAVDDASTDETAAVLDRERERGDLNLTAHRLTQGTGPAAARNAGWRAVTAPLVAFTDDDCRAAPDWLEAGLRRLDESPGAFVQGRTEPDPSQAHLAGAFSRTMSVDRLGPWFQTCNIFYPRDLLEAVGGFDDGLRTGEDADLAWRVIETGAAPAFAPGARVLHAVNRIGPLGKLRVGWRWSDTMAAFARHRGLREAQLTYRVFWKGSHYLLFRLLLALALRRAPRGVRIWLARPYLLHLLERGRVEGGGPAMAPYYLVHDLVEMAAAIRGSVRHRTVVL